MPVTINDNITWEESNQAAWSINGSPTPHTASRWGIVKDGQDLQFFPRAMVGYSVLNDTGGVRRFLPEPYPRFPWLYAREVRFVRQTDEPTDLGPSAMLTYGSVEVEIVYATVEYNIAADEVRPIPQGGFGANELYRYVHRTTTLAVHAQQLPPNVFEFVPVAGETPVGLQEPGSELLSSKTLRYTLYEVPCVEVNGSPQLPPGMRANIDTSVGCVNLDLFDDRYAKGTVLMLAPEESYRKMANGAWCCDVGFNYEVRGCGSTNFNDVLSPDASWFHIRRASGQFQKIRKRGIPAEGPYKLAVLGDCFWPF